MSPDPQARSAEELSFRVHDRSLAGVAWGDASGVPTIALHGWMDNAASFCRLGSLLHGIRLCALDLSGHGRSQLRPALRSSHPFEHVSDVLAVADRLGWERFSIIGHSMGANIALYLSGVVPERVHRCVLLDSFGEAGLEGRKLVERCVDAMRATLVGASPTVYETRRMMTMTRMITSKLNSAAVEAICERGAIELQGGYAWTSGPADEAAIAFTLAESVMQELLRRSSAATLLLVAQQGHLRHRWDRMDDRIQIHPNLTVKWVPGTHGPHLGEECHEVAAIIRDFLVAND